MAESVIVIADQNMPLLDETFGQHARIERLPGRDIRPGDLRSADALLVRSVTRVNETLLASSRVDFVGSATIGCDHLDTRWLESKGIVWSHAPGCNARGAAEYTLAMILLACERLGQPLTGRTAGIIGRGNVGGRVMALLQALGVECVACDPPLADAGESGLVSLDDALQCHIVCVHTPLTRSGPYPTHRMIGAAALARMGDGALLINAGRGDVVDGQALLSELESGRLAACLDVWPNEPAIDIRLLQGCTVGTPHVAGYSVQGKLQGTLTIYRAFCAHFGLEPVMDHLPRAECRSLDLSGIDHAVSAAVTRATGVEQDDGRLRSGIAGSALDSGPAFDELRRTYPERQEFGHWRVIGGSEPDRAKLAAIGFSLHGS